MHDEHWSTANADVDAPPTGGAISDAKPAAAKPGRKPRAPKAAAAVSAPEPASPKGSASDEVPKRKPRGRAKPSN